MSRYEKVDFLMYELQNGFRMALKPFDPPPPPPRGGGDLKKIHITASQLPSLSSQSLTIPHHPSVFWFSLLEVSLFVLLVMNASKIQSDVKL